EQLRVLGRPVDRPGGAQRIHGGVAGHTGLSPGWEGRPAAVLRLPTGGRYREGRHHVGPQAERDAVGLRIGLGVGLIGIDVSGAQPLPCDLASKQAAQTALAGYTTPHVTTQWCVYSSQNQNLGCFTTQATAAQRQRETGQQALLDLIGKTARLEERPTLQI